MAKMETKDIINVTNFGGTSGKLEISDGMSFDLKPPALYNPSEQLSPKHLIAMAWSDCLNATIISIFKENKINNDSRVRVEAESRTNQENGYHYILTAYVAIENYDESETIKFAKMADRLCPISKLIAKNQFVSLRYEKY